MNLLAAEFFKKERLYCDATVIDIKQDIKYTKVLFSI